MGAVYEAVRADDEFNRRVAVKLLRRGLESDLALRRFRNERQILADLAHPNIAALLDGGTTPDGQPYIVMEYVEGAPITRWCDERRLPARERAALLARVCEAVEYAHRNRVVHRDLKPGNILVTEDGTVKLLDFGIAKLIAAADDAGAADPTMTQLGQRAFTPEYAAPEQFREQRVGPAADVYALGVVLFELLTGRRPFEVQGRSFADFERAVCEADPPRPSATMRAEHWRALGERSAARARDRVAGDLDAIAGMALRKEPERRYASAESLGSDLRNHVERRPIAARPESVVRRTRRWVLRHRLEVGVGVLALVLLIGGAATAALAAVSMLGGILATGWQARRAQAEARLAEEAARTAEIERARAEQVRDFLRNMLGATDGLWTGPKPGTRPDVTIAEILDGAASSVGEQLGERPELESEIRRTLGISYRSVGRFPQAVEQFEKAIELERTRQTGPNRDLADTLHHLGQTRFFVGDSDGAEAAIRAAIEEYERAGATTERGYITAISDLGTALWQKGDYERARPRFEQTNELARRYLGEAHPVVAISFANLALIDDNWGDAAEAERLYRAAIDTYQRMEPHTLSEPASCISNLGLLLTFRGRFDEAERLRDRAAEIMDRTVGRDHLQTIGHRHMPVALRYLQGRYAEAEALVSEYREILDRLLPPDHFMAAFALQWYGRILTATGRAAEAEPHLRHALAVLERAFPSGNWRVGMASAALGRSLQLQGRLEEAEPLLRAGCDTIGKTYGAGDLRLSEPTGWLAELVAQLGAESPPEERRGGDNAG
jgi:eukaryotic-like serine/threonine-protein kinase